MMSARLILVASKLRLLMAKDEPALTSSIEVARSLNHVTQPVAETVLPPYHRLIDCERNAQRVSRM